VPNVSVTVTSGDTAHGEDYANQRSGVYTLWRRSRPPVRPWVSWREFGSRRPEVRTLSAPTNSFASHPCQGR